MQQKRSVDNSNYLRKDNAIIQQFEQEYTAINTD